MDFVANTNVQDNGQWRKGRPKNRSGAPNPNPNRLNYLLNQPCPKHGTKEEPANHLWKDCFIMQEFKNSNNFRYDQDLAVAQGPGRVTVEEVPVQHLMVIRTGIMVKIVRTTRVVTTNSSNSQVTRATQSS